MRLKVLLVFVTLLAVSLAGCTSGRDISDEAKEREAWARDHNEYAPVAVLSGPERIQPGALVWYSAHGSHDPDFFGAQRDTERDEARSAGGFHARDDASHVQWSWDMTFYDGGPTGLGDGIRKYVWQIDDQPPLVAPELTHRYGSDDGPVRFPVGFTEAGTHNLTLTVIDWSGDRATVRSTITVTESGTGSTVTGWQVTEGGWATERIVPVSFEQYGECPPISRGHYDEAVHRMRVPWDLLFFSDAVQVEATWDHATVPPYLLAHGAAPEGAVATTATADLPATPLTPRTTAADATPPGLKANLNDIAITLGHCETGDAWARFDTDQGWIEETPAESGSVTAEDLSRHVEKVGAKSERVAEYDFNIYLSDQGSNRWGSGEDVIFRTVLKPASETGDGGQ